MENKEGSQGRERKGHEEEGSRVGGGGRGEGEEKQEIKNILSTPTTMYCYIPQHRNMTNHGKLGNKCFQNLKTRWMSI